MSVFDPNVFDPNVFDTQYVPTEGGPWLADWIANWNGNWWRHEDIPIPQEQSGRNQGSLRAPRAATMVAIMPRAVTAMTPAPVARNAVHVRPMISTGPRPARRIGPRGVG